MSNSNEKRKELLKGFTSVELSGEVEDCYLTIRKKGLRFNRTTARTLGRPDYICISINKDQKKLAIFPAVDGEMDKVEFKYDEGGRNNPIIVGEGHVMKQVSEVVVLEEGDNELALQVRGSFHSEANVIIFDLTEATKKTVKRRRRKSRKLLESSASTGDVDDKDT